MLKKNLLFFESQVPSLNSSLEQQKLIYDAQMASACLLHSDVQARISVYDTKMENLQTSHTVCLKVHFNISNIV